jgi:hypothetical protein
MKASMQEKQTGPGEQECTVPFVKAVAKGTTIVAEASAFEQAAGLPAIAAHRKSPGTCGASKAEASATTDWNRRI